MHESSAGKSEELKQRSTRNCHTERAESEGRARVRMQRDIVCPAQGFRVGARARVPLDQLIQGRKGWPEDFKELMM